jgi:hypothetical protein
MSLHRLTPTRLAVAAALLVGAACPAWAAEAALAYTVQSRDTLIGLGKTLLVSPQAWPEVARLNRLPDPDRLTPGQTLQVPLRLLRSAQAPARIVSVEGPVTLEGRPARAGDAVQPGQRLVTEASGSAVLQLGDGSRVQLTPLTEAELSEHRRFDLRAGTGQDGLFASTMRLLRGSLEVVATKLQRAKPLEVTTPTAVIGVRGTEYRVRHADAGSGTEVLEGRVQADVGEQGVALAGGFGAALQPGQAPRAVPLLPPPDLSALPARFERPLIRLRFPGSEPVRVQLAADEGFSRIVRDERVPAGGELRVAGLDDGTWQLRARRIDAAGIEGRDARATVVLKARPEPPAAMAPTDRGKAMVGEVRFAWAENTEAAAYRLEVASDAAFRQVLQRQDGLRGGSAVLRLDEPGALWWRLASVRANGDAGPWGDPQTLELRAQPTPPQASMDAERLSLAWGGRPGDRQQVQLARDPDFSRPEAEATLDKPSWLIKRPSQPGTVYFRYRSVEPDGFTTPWSSTLKLEIPRDWRDAGWLLLPLLLVL